MVILKRNLQILDNYKELGYQIEKELIFKPPRPKKPPPPSSSWQHWQREGSITGVVVIFWDVCVWGEGAWVVFWNVSDGERTRRRLKLPKQNRDLQRKFEKLKWIKCVTVDNWVWTPEVGKKGIRITPRATGVITSVERSTKMKLNYTNLLCKKLWVSMRTIM